MGSSLNNSVLVVGFVFNPRAWRVFHSTTKFPDTRLDFVGQFGPFTLDVFIPR